MIKDSAITAAEQEPMGIVISRGSRQEAVPVLAAYVWAPAPEIIDEIDVHAA